MVRAWLSLLRFSWLLLLLFVWLLDRLLLVMLFVSRKFLILLLVRRQRSLIRILCLFSVSVIKHMLTKQNIIVNQKRLADYEQCRYLCKNKQEFIENLSCDNVIEFAAICDSLGLEISMRQVDYFTEQFVGKQSPYYVESDQAGFLSEEEIREYESRYNSPLDCCCLFMYFTPVQLELPYD